MSNLSIIEGNPIAKLFDIVNSTIGVINLPLQQIFMKDDGSSLNRIKAIEGAKTDALLANGEGRYAELTAIEKRVAAKELKRQNNINNVVAIAAQSLKDETEVSSEPVNPDWATRFFDIAQDISDETMQDLWGRILAGEVKRPKSYSLRTLEVLRNITREEAELFEKIAQYVIYDGAYYIYRDIFGKDSKINCRYAEIAQLMEIGLVQSNSMVVQNLYNDKGEGFEHHLYYGNRYVAFIEMPNYLKKISFPIYPLTHVGRELNKLISPEPNCEYFEYVLRKILEENEHLSKDIHITYAKLIRIDNEKGEFEYDDESIVEISTKSSANA